MMVAVFCPLLGQVGMHFVKNGIESGQKRFAVSAKPDNLFRARNVNDNFGLFLTGMVLAVVEKINLNISRRRQNRFEPACFVTNRDTQSVGRFAPAVLNLKINTPPLTQTTTPAKGQSTDRVKPAVGSEACR